VTRHMNGLPRVVCQPLLLLVLGCSGGSPSGPSTPNTPDPGPLRLRLDGAPGGGEVVLIEVMGASVQSVFAGQGLQLASETVSNNRTLLLVRGNLMPRVLATLTVPDRRQSYTATIVDVAAGRAGGYSRQQSSQYRVVIERQ